MPGGNSESHESMVDEVFKNLVDQFSDPFTCLRELVQNAMDAGTEVIEIKTLYLPDPGGVCLEIRDFGEGMNRDIIDGKLTRLFSSDKENDLTKIGKFGIGFVSVFSLKPELVIVDTGRDGEYWRIAFDGGTDFQLFELHSPLEGTSVRLHKLLPFTEYEEFRERCFRTVSKWCRHSDVQIQFNEQLVNQALEVDSPCRVDVKDALGQFNVGLTNDLDARYGLYNTGLTLTEGVQQDFSGVSFKILSNHLEHTLTRDAVIVDGNYHKVMARLKEIVENELFEQVCAQLQSPKSRDVTAGVAGTYLRSRLDRLSTAQKKRPFLKDLFDTDLSLADLQKCAKEETRLFCSQNSSNLAKRATREGIPVLPFPCDSPAAELLSSLLEVPAVSLETNLAISRPVERPPALKLLEPHIRALLREGRILVRSVVLVEYPDSVPDPDSPPCTFALGADRLVRRFRKGFWGTKYLLPQQLLLDIRHPLIRKALSRADDPAGKRIAVYAICKAALLNDGLDPGTEARLLNTILERA
jgi:molecular chaperone HtpG